MAEEKKKRVLTRQRPTQKHDGINPVDAYIGGRIRLRRTLLGLSQMDLAKAIRMTFQQVQKYERGFNRVSGSVLWEISQALDCTPSFFFDGLQEVTKETEPGVSPTPLMDEDYLSRANLEMIRDLSALPTELQVEMRKMVRAVASEVSHKAKIADQGL